MRWRAAVVQILGGDKEEARESSRGDDAPLRPKLRAEGKPQTGPAKSALPLVPSGRKTKLADVDEAARDCKACPLWKDNVGTVFGEGPHDARAVLVGEQPGDIEDVQGRPFVGPAGRLLDEALVEAGLDRSKLYLTNAVKHFKHHRVREKKRRLHDKPTAAEMKACRPWLDAEIAHIEPKVLVALGATAAKQLLGNTFSITAERGNWRVTSASMRTMATWHPSAILRTRAIDKDRAEAMRRQLVEDLRKVKKALED